MNKPISVRIGGFNYDIYYVPIVNEAKRRYGEINFNQHTIRVSSEFSEQQQKCTLLHEAVHGIDDWLDIGLEEEQVVKLGKGLYQLIRDNPRLIEAVAEGGDPADA